MGVFKSCIDCADRYPGCHGKCEKYLSEKAAYDEVRANKDSDLPVRAYHLEHKQDIYDRRVRKRQKLKNYGMR